MIPRDKENGKIIAKQLNAEETYTFTAKYAVIFAFRNTATITTPYCANIYSIDYWGYVSIITGNNTDAIAISKSGNDITIKNNRTSATDFIILTN